MASIRDKFFGEKKTLKGDKQSISRQKWKDILHEPIARWALCILIAFPPFICFALNLLNCLAPEEGDGYFAIKPGVSDWFAFWGSFSGTIATVFVGILTLHLTSQIEKEHRIAEQLRVATQKQQEEEHQKTEQLREEAQKQQQEAEKLQKKMSVIMNMPNIICESMEMFCFNRGDICQELMDFFADYRNYVMLFKLKPAFPAYFIVSLDEYELIFYRGQEQTVEQQVFGKLEKEKDYKIVNHDDFKLYLNVDAEAEKYLFHFYTLHLQVTDATPYRNKNIDIRLKLKCENALFKENDGVDSAVTFNMILTLESEGKKGACGVRWKANNIQFEKAE